MAPRTYRQDRRTAARADTRRRILDATAALHAKKGVLATSYADIAAMADVAVPTVYNHFPDRQTLLHGCVSHVSAQAPPVPDDLFAGARSLPQRVEAAVGALFAAYAFFRPWLIWTLREIGQLPELAFVEAARTQTRTTLVRQALAPSFRGRPTAELLAIAGALVDFPSWLNLAEACGVNRAPRVASEALVVLAQHYRSRRKTARPKES